MCYFSDQLNMQAIGGGDGKQPYLKVTKHKFETQGVLKREIMPEEPQLA